MYETLVIVVLALMRYRYEADPEYYWHRQHDTFVPLTTEEVNAMR